MLNECYSLHASLSLEKQERGRFFLLLKGAIREYVFSPKASILRASAICRLQQAALPLPEDDP